MTDQLPTSPRPLSPRAQAILERAEREAQLAAGAPREPAAQPVLPPATPDPQPPSQAHGLARPRPAHGGHTAPQPPRPAQALEQGTPPQQPTVDHLLALVDALARRTEVARRQLEELTTAIDALLTNLAQPAGPPEHTEPPRPMSSSAPQPEIRWPAASPGPQS